MKQGKVIFKTALKTNKMNKKKLSDSEILNNVISALGESTHSLSVKLGYKSPASVYHVINEVNNLSSGMIDRIVKIFPNVSMIYLKTGEGSIILKDEELQAQMNILNTHTDPTIDFFKKLVAMPERIDNIEKTLKEIQEQLKK